MKDKQNFLEKPFLSVEETCIYLNISKPTLYAYTSRKKIPHYKFNRKLLFKVSELNEMIQNNRIKPMYEIEAEALQDFRRA
jgi:excisionase family DNA binding protein